MRIYSLAPVIRSDAHLLILGSMPGEQSLQQQHYYGNPRNHFWTIMAMLLEWPDSQVPLEYAERIERLQEARIALWDVLASCERRGSLDATIRKEETNDILSLLDEVPSIQAIVCNGSKAFQTLLKAYGQELVDRQIEVVRCPSTSPIPTKQMRSIQHRVEAWQPVLRLLQR